MTEMILCGRGGQGIVFLTRQIGNIGAKKGWDVISSETHGMAVRGGSINSHLRIGDYFSSLIMQGHADMIISLDPLETKNNIHFLKPGGIVVENSPIEDQAGFRRVDGARLARRLGRVQLENVVILGFCAGQEEFPIKMDDIRKELENHPRQEVRDMNLRALEMGFDERDKRGT
jgi:indolepyruvate ferredoxin oxidoreductase beta subunit